MSELPPSEGPSLQNPAIAGEASNLPSDMDTLGERMTMVSLTRAQLKALCEAGQYVYTRVDGKYVSSLARLHEATAICEKTLELEGWL